MIENSVDVPEIDALLLTLSLQLKAIKIHLAELNKENWISDQFDDDLICSICNFIVLEAIMQFLMKDGLY